MSTTYEIILFISVQFIQKQILKLEKKGQKMKQIFIYSERSFLMVPTMDSSSR